MKVVVASPVWSDVAEIARRIAEDNPEAALRIIEAAQKNFELIGVHPGIGRLRTFSQPGVRSWPITDFPNYLIFYLPRQHEITIIAVIHGARNLRAIVESRL